MRAWRPTLDDGHPTECGEVHDEGVGRISLGPKRQRLSTSDIRQELCLHPSARFRERSPQTTGMAVSERNVLRGIQRKNYHLIGSNYPRPHSVEPSGLTRSASENVILGRDAVFANGIGPGDALGQLETRIFDYFHTPRVLGMCVEEFDQNALDPGIRKRGRRALEYERLVTVDVNLDMRRASSGLLYELVDRDACAPLTEFSIEF